MDAPKLFISYSWSNQEHEQRVIGLASELRQSGVDVILDKWDLKEGHDAVAFMERMVTDPCIRKVAIVCDEKYAVKADGRAGGVGTETQIISREVYENQAQEKFVAVVCEKDEKGKPYLPTYYKSRIYIDLADTDTYSENFERLLRWIYDKPLYAKPDLGSRPSFLAEGEHQSLGTSALAKRCIDAVKNGKAHAAGSLDEYCSTFAINLERFRLTPVQGEEDDALIKSIEEFVPYRNEAVHLLTTIAQYSDNEFVKRIHRLFESLIPYLDRPPNINQWQAWDFDNFKFLAHELFLYAVAVFLKFEKFEAANYLFSQRYYVPGQSDYGRDVMVPYTAFRHPVEMLNHRNKRLGLRRLSLRAELLRARTAGSGLDFRELLQADFVAFLRAEIELKGERRWWPETLVYAPHGAFEIFARSVSESYFNKVKVLLNVASKTDLEPVLASYSDGSRRLPRWEYEGFDPASLLAFDRLATAP